MLIWISKVTNLRISLLLCCFSARFGDGRVQISSQSWLSTRLVSAAQVLSCAFAVSHGLPSPFPEEDEGEGVTASAPSHSYSYDKEVHWGVSGDILIMYGMVLIFWKFSFLLFFYLLLQMLEDSLEDKLEKELAAEALLQGDGQNKAEGEDGKVRG